MKPQNGSYPYRNIAKKFDVDYGDTMLCAESLLDRGVTSKRNIYEAVERVYKSLTPGDMRLFTRAIERQVEEFKVIQAEGWD